MQVVEDHIPDQTHPRHESVQRVGDLAQGRQVLHALVGEGGPLADPTPGRAALRLVEGRDHARTPVHVHRLGHVL